MENEKDAKEYKKYIKIKEMLFYIDLEKPLVRVYEPETSTWDDAGPDNSGGNSFWDILASGSTVPKPENVPDPY